MTISMENAKELILPNISKVFMKTADMLLVLDDGVAILCHSQILSMHSAVLCNMLADLASQRNEKVSVPLPDFTEAQCSALLAYLYNNGVSSKGAAFEGHDAADHDAAVAVARFAHTYDAPYALRHVEANLTALMDADFKCKKYCGPTGICTFENRICTFEYILEWAVMADKFHMHELCGHCERAMVMYWEGFQDKPKLLDQLSSGALQRIAKGLNSTLLATARRHSQEYSLGIPGVQEFTAWT